MQRTVIAVGLVAVVLAALLIGRYVIRSNYYVGAYNNTVTIFRGLNSSFLGLTLNDPYLVGCLSDVGNLSLLAVGQTGQNCQLFTLEDLRPAEQALVGVGFEETTFESARGQIEDLARKALPICESPAPSISTPTPIVPATPSETPGSTMPPGPPGPGPGTPDSSESPLTETPALTTDETQTTTDEPRSVEPTPQEPGIDCRAAA